MTHRMLRLLTCFALVASVIAACGGQPTPTPAPAAPQPTKAVVPTKAVEPPTAAVPTQAVVPTKPASAPIGAGARAIDASGWIYKNGTVELETWYAFTSEEAIPADTGAYSIAALDASGKELATQSFPVSFNTLSNPPQVIDPAPFEGVAVAFPEGTVKFVIKKGGAVLKEVAVSANAPEVSAVTVPADLKGEATLTWQATDKDNDQMVFDVEYSQTGKEEDYFVLATGLTEPQWTDDFSQLPGGETALIRVTASDGINTGEAVSSEFKVDYRAPEAFIDEPTDGATFAVGEEIALDGYGYDAQDEDLYEDSQLAWYDGETKLGDGTTLYIDTLPAGKHVIKLEATNSHGLKGSQTVTITIQ